MTSIVCFLLEEQLGVEHAAPMSAVYLEEELGVQHAAVSLDCPPDQHRPALAPCSPWRAFWRWGLQAYPGG